MKNTFYVGENPKHKIDAHFSSTGKEQVMVDNVLVIDRRSLKFQNDISFKAGKHNVLIKFEGNMRGWKCPVYVDNSLLITELFPDDLGKQKRKNIYLKRYYIFLAVALFLGLLASFLKGFFYG